MKGLKSIIQNGIKTTTENMRMINFGVLGFFQLYSSHIEKIKG